MIRKIGFIWLLGLGLYGQSSSKTQVPSQPPERQSLLEGFQDKAITGIELTSPTGKVALERKATKWYLEGQPYAANPLYVSILLKVLKQAGPGTRVAQPHTNHDAYGFIPKTMRRVILKKDGQTVATLEVGSPEPGYRSCFVRIPDEGWVRLVKADLVPALYRRTWLDPTVWRVPQGLIQKVYTHGLAQDLIAHRQGDQWIILSPKEGELTEVFTNKLLPKLAWMRSSDTSVIDGAFEKESLAGPHFIIGMVAADAIFELQLKVDKQKSLKGFRPNHGLLYTFPSTLRTLLEQSWTTQSQ